MNIKDTITPTLALFVSIFLLFVSFNVTADKAATRIITLSSQGVERGHVQVLSRGSDQSGQSVEMRANLKNLCCLDGGNKAYGLYMWTSTYGRQRLYTFCPSIDNCDIHLPVPGTHNFPALQTDDICLEVWTETDDGTDAPDSSVDMLVLQGGDGDGDVCTTLKP